MVVMEMFDQQSLGMGRSLVVRGVVVPAIALVVACSSTPPLTQLREAGTDATSPADATTGDGAKGPPDAAKQIGWGDGGDGLDGPMADILIADQFNNRVIEIDWQGNIVWTFGDGSSKPGPTSIVAPNDAERLPNGDTLIAGSGLPSGNGAYDATEQACRANGCADDRVILVNKSGAITWQYGMAGVPGAGANQLSAPVGVQMLSTGNVLITDQGNNRIIEVTPKGASGGTIVWQFPPLADASSAQALNSPNSAQRLANGNTLIADENNSRVIEVDTTTSGKIIWQYPANPAAQFLNIAAFASRLPNGNTLISDSGNSRVIEVTQTLDVTVIFNTAARAGSFPMPFPAHALRLADGETLISDQLNDQVIEVKPNPQEHIVFAYGQTQVAGKGPNELWAPYDAKVIGDYTGLSTPPPP
jgi:hypothetical protein